MAARRDFRVNIGEAAKIAQTAGVPLGQIADDLRSLADIYAKPAAGRVYTRDREGATAAQEEGS